VTINSCGLLLWSAHFFGDTRKSSCFFSKSCSSRAITTLAAGPGTHRKSPGASQQVAAKLGELQHASGRDDIGPIVELGEITSGRRPGRERDDQITVCDLTGTGVQDTAIALLACEKARAKGLGTAIES
jgi:hypothetical protein